MDIRKEREKTDRAVEINKGIVTESFRGLERDVLRLIQETMTRVEGTFETEKNKKDGSS